MKAYVAAAVDELIITLKWGKVLRVALATGTAIG